MSEQFPLTFTLTNIMAVDGEGNYRVKVLSVKGDTRFSETNILEKYQMVQ